MLQEFRFNRNSACHHLSVCLVALCRILCSLVSLEQLSALFYQLSYLYLTFRDLSFDSMNKDKRLCASLVRILHFTEQFPLYCGG